MKTEFEHKYHLTQHAMYKGKEYFILGIDCINSKPVYTLIDDKKKQYPDIAESELSEVRKAPTQLHTHTYKEKQFVTYKGLTCSVMSAHFNLGRPVYNLSPFVSWFCKGGMVTYRDIPEYEVKELQKPNPYSEAKTASTEDIAKAITQVIEKHPKKSIIAALFLVGLALIDEKK